MKGYLRVECMSIDYDSIGIVCGCLKLSMECIRSKVEGKKEKVV